MMMNLLHTPEGVRDIYNKECAEKMVLQEKLQKVLKLYGFSAIETPTFEFFDIFSKDIGTIPSKDLYKFFERDGHTLALRPDITPSVARSVAKYFSEEDMPIRLWYQGNTFINNSSYQGRLKEVTQVGAEYIGDGSVDGDGEILALVVRLLKEAGLKEFQISVGHVDFFQELIKAARLEEETVEELKALISNKNFFGVEEVIDPLPLPQDLKCLFNAMGVLYGSPDFPCPLREKAAPYPEISKVLNHLCTLYGILKLYGISDYVTIDLGSMSPFHYYTGIIFSGYTFGSGEPVVKGGRYDKLLSYFGKSAPSIGFAIEIEQLMATLARQDIPIPVEQKCQLYVYRARGKEEAIFLAEMLRSRGDETMLLRWKKGKTKEDYIEYARRSGLNDVTFVEE